MPNQQTTTSTTSVPKTSASNTGTTDNLAKNMQFSSIILLVVLLSAWLFAGRSQKKRDKEAALLKKNLEIGDEVVTIGGIVGIVVNLKDDVFTLETGSDCIKLRLQRWAIQSNLSAEERLAKTKGTEKNKKENKK